MRVGWGKTLGLLLVLVGRAAPQGQRKPQTPTVLDRNATFSGPPLLQPSPQQGHNKDSQASEAGPGYPRPLRTLHSAPTRHSGGLLAGRARTCIASPTLGRGATSLAARGVDLSQALGARGLPARSGWELGAAGRSCPHSTNHRPLPCPSVLMPSCVTSHRQRRGSERSSPLPQGTLAT